MQEKLFLGNLAARRDWGYAPEFVEGMWLMLQQEEPDDFVLATGEAHSVEEFCGLAFERAGMPLVFEGEGEQRRGVDAEGKVRVAVDPRYYRPTEVDQLIGDPTKATEKLGWAPETLILQAIATVLGRATQRLKNPADLAWPGFDLSLADRNWGAHSSIEIDVEFSDKEISETKRLFHMVPALHGRHDAVEPGDSKTVTLVLENGEVMAPTPAELFQFLGRSYARQVLSSIEEGFEVFKRVGSVFWYTEHRQATSLNTEDGGEGASIADMDILRRRLSDFMRFHENLQAGRITLKPGRRDLFKHFEKAYRRVFPDRAFVGMVPRGDVDQIMEEPWFYLRNGSAEYEISELSGGERAVFPLLFDFANLNIHRSVVLIDELELHLHPPGQQTLLGALPLLGNDNQFFVTTHSDAVEGIVPESAVLRLS